MSNFKPSNCDSVGYRVADFIGSNIDAAIGAASGWIFLMSGFRLRIGLYVAIYRLALAACGCQAQWTQNQSNKNIVV